MPKQATQETTTPAVSAPDEITLGEFCQRLSTSDRRVELIAGFHSEEVRAGKAKDLESAYMARFQEFVTKPV